MADSILVVGGTGMLGKPVVKRLTLDGHPVRVVTRQPDRARIALGKDVEVVSGDVDDPESIVRALDGCMGVHINLDGHGDWDLERRGAACVARAAAKGRVSRVTLISGASACEQNASFPMTRAKLDAERAVAESGIPYTVFRCTMFMEVLPNYVKDGKVLLMGDQPYPWHWVAADDYARMVSLAHRTPAAAGKILHVRGPEALTFEQALERFRVLCLGGAPLQRLPFWLLGLVSLFPSRHELRKVGLPLMRYFARVTEVGDPTEATTLLGPPTTTLEQWCSTYPKALMR
jgi:uncharacterized protein YbjT (DUF2867 family)